MASEREWMEKAALYELLAVAFRYPTEELADALATGEFAEALVEICTACDLDVAGIETDALGVYVGLESRALLHFLRQEHTRLFIGNGKALVSPYAGVWHAEREGLPALLMVGGESMAIERFMRRCGIGQPVGTNEPLDNIASMLEFLHYLCLCAVGAVAVPAHAEMQEGEYAAFFDAHFDWFRIELGQAVMRQSKEPLFVCAARILSVLVK